MYNVLKQQKNAGLTDGNTTGNVQDFFLPNVRRRAPSTETSTERQPRAPWWERILPPRRQIVRRPPGVAAAPMEAKNDVVAHRLESYLF